MVKKILNIIIGWFRKIFELKEDMASIRLNICNHCPHKINTPLGDACSLCGCILDAKTRVEDEQCDLDKW
jgi:hypothetical protein